MSKDYGRAQESKYVNDRTKAKENHAGLKKKGKQRRKLHMDKRGLQWLGWQEARATAEYSPLKITTSPQLDYRPH